MSSIALIICLMSFFSTKKGLDPLKVSKKTAGTTLCNKEISTGFTLVELLVVIMIIGVLAMILVALVNSATVKGRDAKRLSDMQSISTAMEMKRIDNNNKGYPDIANNQQIIPANSHVLAPYLDSVPRDTTPNHEYRWKDRNTPSTCYCAWVLKETNNHWILANSGGVKEVSSNPNSGNCCTK